MNDTTIFKAQVFHEKLDNGRSSGEITIDRAAIKISYSGGMISIPISDCRIRLGGASDRLVFISHPLYPDWSVHTPDRKILSHPALADNTSVSKQVRSAKNKRIFNWSILAAIILVIAGIPASFFIFLDPITHVIAQKLPTEWERKLGESTLENFRSQHGFIDSQEINRQLGELTRPLLHEIEQNRFNFELYISRDENINAFALPGGYIVINSGLILEASNAEEILGVLAHEIAHVTEQHGIRGIIKTVGIYSMAQALLGDASGIMAFIANAAPLLINQSYSRDFEAEADETGYNLLVESGIDPDGLYSFFNRIREEEKKLLRSVDNANVQRLLEKTFSLLSTHPATDDRIARLRSFNKPENINYIDIDNELDLLKQSVSEYLKDHTEEDQ